MRIASSPHLSCALAVLPPKFPLRPWLVLSLLLSFVSGHERTETFSIRFFMGNRKPGNVMWPRSCCLVCRLEFTFERQEGLSAISDLRQGFFYLQKLCSLTFKGTSQLSISTCDVLLRFLISKQWIIYVFGRKKNKELRISKNNMAALNNERLGKIWNPGNVKLQTEKPDAKGL